jgi:hypothetical protein
VVAPCARFLDRKSDATLRNRNRADGAGLPDVRTARRPTKNRAVAAPFRLRWRQVSAPTTGVRIDLDAVPWRAVGKLQAASINLRASCTATLVGPSTVVTAAHCVFNRRTQRNFPRVPAFPDRPQRQPRRRPRRRR